MSSDPQRDDLQATIDTIHEDAATLIHVEEAKRDLDPTDPRMAALSETAVRLGQRLQKATVAELEITDQLQSGEPAQRPN